MRANNDLYLWLPDVPELAYQRNLQPLRATHQPLFSDVASVTVFQLADLSPNRRYAIESVVLFDRYRIRSAIEADQVASGYAQSAEFMRRFTSASALVPSEDETISAVAAREGRGNPYQRAAALYRYVLERLSPLAGQGAEQEAEQGRTPGSSAGIRV